MRNWLRTNSLFLTVALGGWLVILYATPKSSDYFKITIVDEETGRGVPLVELRTTGEARYYTDSNGVVAFYEPDLMGQTVFFHIKSHGYEFPSDGLYRGKALPVTSGGQALLKIRRLNVAERLYRLTGEGIYRDSRRVGHPVPLKPSPLRGQVVGQDTVIATPYRGKLYWFWGDTNRPSYPLGNFSASGATAERPDQGGLDPSVGVDLIYFVDASGFSKPMCPFPGPGLKWIVGLMTVKDEKGSERLIAQYSRMKSLGYAYEWGLAIFNDEKQVFEPLVRFDRHEPHRSAHPFRVHVNGEDYYYLFPNVRVKADLKQLMDLKAYESFTCLVAGSRYDKSSPPLERGPNGQLIYGWKADTAPIEEDRERELIAAGKIRPEEAWFRLYDIDTGAPIEAYVSSVCWNDFRRRWVMLAEKNGQVWYAEGDTPVGPWVYAKKIVTHDRYSFYNVTQHPFFDQDGGRLIYFEGTYSDTFSGSPEKTPRYDYNQMMYRLALDHPRLCLPIPVYRVQGVGRATRYLLREGVESQDGWNRVEDVAFFAVPPDRRRQGLIPIFAVADSGAKSRGLRLQTDAPAAGMAPVPPLFYALPAVPLPPDENLTGGWQCRIKSADGSEFYLDFEWKLDGEKVEGRARSDHFLFRRGTFKDGNLAFELQLQEDQTIYSFTARLSQGKLSGEWRQGDSDERGVWVGTRADSERQPLTSPAVVPLYEYRRGNDGTRVYSTDAHLADPALTRSAGPICRVWRNPMSVLILDRKAKPVPVARTESQESPENRKRSAQAAK